MKGIHRFLIVTALSLVVIPASAQQLGLGDPAPKLQVKSFAKGVPVRSLETGKLYVVEMWATWCGPCRETIPHLSRLQKQYPQVTFIGVSILEENQSDVAPFVRQMGSKMDYRVALDLVPKGKQKEDGRMAQTWMRAAGQSGVPTAFIINRERKIAWIGHPGEMEEPLDKIVKGTWDLRGAVAVQSKQRASARILQALQGQLKAADKAKSPKKALAAVEAALTKDQSLEETLGLLKLTLLTETGADSARVAAYGNRLVDKVYPTDPRALTQLAGQLVSPKAPASSPEVKKLALKSAIKADQITKGGIHVVAHTLARCYYVSGDRANALSHQERAVRLSKGTQEEAEMKRTLDQYRKGTR